MLKLKHRAVLYLLRKDELFLIAVFRLGNLCMYDGNLRKKLSLSFMSSLKMSLRVLSLSLIFNEFWVEIQDSHEFFFEFPSSNF